MPKLKTKKSIVKRFKITKTGKVLRRRSFARHLNVKKSANRKRALRRTAPVTKSYANRIRKAMGIRKKIK